MNELMKWSNFEDMDKEISKQLENVTTGFIYLGYLFKKARDSKLYEEAGFQSVYEYAQKKYNITRTQALRFMQINDTYSIDGYSGEINPCYIGYGSSKLTEMLGLPAEIREQIPPEVTVKELRNAKAILEQTVDENELCDVAQTIENTESEEEFDVVKKSLFWLFRNEKEMFKNLHQELKEAIEEGDMASDLRKDRLLCALAPSKFAMKRTEAGNIMISANGIKIMPFGKANIQLTLLEFCGVFSNLINSPINASEDYEDLYGIPLVEKKPEELTSNQGNQQKQIQKSNQITKEDEVEDLEEENEDEESLAEEDPEEELEETVEEIIETPPADETDVHQPQEELGKVTIIPKPVIEGQPAAVLEEGKDLGDLLDDIEYESQTLWKSIINWKAEKLSMKDLTDADEQLQKIRDLLYELMEEKK